MAMDETAPLQPAGCSSKIAGVPIALMSNAGRSDSATALARSPLFSNLGRLDLARLAGLGDKPAAELAGHPAVTARVGQTVDRANRGLASYAQIKKFVVVAQDFSQEGGELTPTLKVKRREVQAKYSGLLEALYQP